MYAHAISAIGEGGCCGWGEVNDLRSLLRAMTGRGEGPGGGRHRHRGFGGHHSGPRGFGGFPFGDLGPRGGPSWRGGRKARRGDIRTAALLLLAEEPRNGYEIMQEVEQRSDGFWRPSPGSVYPALQQLEDEGLIRSEEVDGRKVFQLTDAGRAHVEERGADSPAPWEQMSGGFSPPAVELAKVMREVAVAFTQVIRGSDAQLAEARTVLVNVRRDLYRILADGGEDAESR